MRLYQGAMICVVLTFFSIARAVAQGVDGSAERFSAASWGRPQAEEVDLSAPANLDVEDVSIGEALLALYRSTGVAVAFSPSLLPQRRKVTCRCERATIADAIRTILRGTGFEFRLVAGQLVVRRADSVAGASAGRSAASSPDQEPSSSGDRGGRASSSDRQAAGTITGRVVDGQTSQPLGSVQVYIQSLDLGVLTQANGRYLLRGVPAGSQTITAERIGYRTVTQAVTVADGQTVVQDFQLAQQALQLDEVVVTGTAGGTRRRALGNSVTSVSASRVSDQAQINSVDELLTAESPGLDFGRLPGNVGTGSPIQIRGVSTLDLDQEPLIYVDGVRVNNSTEAGPKISSGNREAVVSVLQDFSPDEIESIQVIKGPAAATLYGTEASAGVIQILTKKGKEGDPAFHATVSQGGNYLANPSGKIGTQWGLNSSGDLVEGFLDQNTGKRYPNVYEYEKNVNGNDPLQTGRTQSYGLDVRGGTSAVRYYLAGRWQNDAGMVDYNYDKKLNLRANVDVVFSNAFTVSVSTGYVSGFTSFAQQLSEPGGIWDSILWAQPELKDTNRRGFLRYTPEELAGVGATRQYERFTSSATFKYQLGNWLTQRLVVGLDRGSDENQVLVPRQPLGTASAFGGLGLGDVVIGRPMTRDWTLDYGASANYALNEALSFTSSIGGQFYSTEVNEIDGEGSVLASPALRSIEGATRVDIGQSFVQNKSLGVYFQQQFNWRDRVFLTGAVRADGNSAFGANFDAVIYPKVSAAWVLSDEDFWNVPFVSSLRLRSALGQSGRQPKTFDAVTLYEARTGRGGEPAMAPLSIGNADVGPEIGTELEVGFDYALLDDRVSGEFTWFHQWTREALARLPLLPSEGFSGSEAANVAQLNNWGWEATMDAQLFQRAGWGLEMNLSASHDMNKIISLGGRPPTPSVQEGIPYPVQTSDVLLSAKLDENGKPVDLMCDGGTGKTGVERGGPPVPCSPDGNPVVLGPDFPVYTVSAAPTLSLLGRKLQLFALAEGNFGQWVRSTDIWCRYAGCFTNTRVSLALDDPVYVAGQVFQNHPYDRTLVGQFDASFIKLRRIGVRYQLPGGWVQGFGADRASISISGSNMWTIWQRTKQASSGVPIIDPEFTGARTGNLGDSDLGRMPPLSSFAVRMDVSF